MKQTSWVPATILVMSNMIGTGIFMLPSQLSKIGGISLISWLITLVGVISLALVLAKLAYLSPKSAGLYSYVKVAFGKYCGHQINFIYSFAGIIGNVAVISVLSGYLADIMPVLKLPFMSLISQIIILGLVFIVNIKGYRAINFLQSASLLLSLTPVIYLIFFGWNLFSLETFKAGWNITHISTGKA
ncbi:MAG: arginine:agmatine antiporter, partial [Burkholderiales bacterium]|nr:arginine:agmatine antiporter [Burkholderiales bacterium]